MLKNDSHNFLPKMLNILGLFVFSGVPRCDYEFYIAIKGLSFRAEARTF